MAEAVAVQEKQQVWFCEVCETVGNVAYTSNNSDVMSVVYLIDDDHIRLSSDCQNGVRRIRVVNPTMNWEPTVPEWARDKIAAFLNTLS